MASPAPHRPDLHRLTLNTDGQRHPRENALALIALGAGLLSLLFAISSALHVPGSVLGAAGVLVAAYDQMISKTTAERWVIVVAGIASALGLALNIAHGGFLP